MENNEKTKTSVEEEIEEITETAENQPEVDEVDAVDTVDTEEKSQNRPSENTELDAANEKIAGLSDKLMRKAAEFENFKKRTAKEKEDFYKMAVCETVLPLLSVLDNLERAVTAAEDAGEGGSVLDGVKMIEKQFIDTLTNIGITKIDAVGKEFDPEMHNAVMTCESDEAENTVIEEFQKGYVYKDKVVRHSMVKVSN